MDLHRNFNGVIATILFLLLAVQSTAQTKFSFSELKEMKVSGTSTIHDWEMVAEKGVSATASMSLENGQLKGIFCLKVELKAESLKSGNKGMDNNAYKALVTDKHPTISFELVGPAQINGNKISANGKMTISGTSQTIPMVVAYQVNGSKVTFSGTKEIKFTDYKIDPPKAVFGTIKTGNELTLSFDIALTQAP
ncbi:YceI family protein [Algoriphagus halophilus]|nr:YceI family protein [Algoriphagus halophilus]